MQIAFHLGAPFTDEDQLIWSLREDRHALSEAGIVVPRPRDFRKRLSDIVPRLRGKALSPAEQESLLTEFGAAPGAERLVLSDPSFICSPKKIWFEDRFYGKAGFKSAWLRQAFDMHEAEFFLCVRNPASFLSELLRTYAPMSMAEHVQGGNPGAMFWSDVVRTIRDDNPGCPITVWANEDTPVIWPLVLAAVGGIEPDTPLEGAANIANALLTEEGQQSLAETLGKPIRTNMVQTLVALEDHLALYADENAVDEFIDIPGWTEIHVDAVTQAYEDDLRRIEMMPGVTFFRP